jgi:phospholipid/cholesterol/gamma-HCH transport system substrate-binding protein
MTHPATRRDFWLGLALGLIVGAALLLSVYYVPRKGLNLGASPLPFTVVLTEAHGLHPGSPVHISGVEAGEVRALRIAEIPDLGFRVLATAEIFDGARFGGLLTASSTYAVAKSGLLGENILAITPGGAGEPLEPGALVDGTAPHGHGRRPGGSWRTSHADLADFTDGRNPGDPSLRATR